jgi:hypothetical protein
MLLMMPYLEMAITTINSKSVQSTDPIRFENMTGTLKETEMKIADQGDVETDNILNDYDENNATSDFDNSTDSDDSDIDKIHSSFNLAIIPAAGVLVFIIIICFKCCKWFRQYTRADDKENNFYAVIVTEDDNEHVDITSDTTSTVCYDTVSSNGSFLKRSGNESTFNSIRFWRQSSFKGEKVLSTPLGNVNKGSGSRQETVPATPPRNRRKKVNEQFVDHDFRISTSSAETISEQISDSPVIKRNNRFRVSFVTETKQSTADPLTTEIRQNPNSSFKQENPMRSSLKKSSPKMNTNETEFSFSKDTPGHVPVKAKMVDVGTQTNKSFRYSLRKTKGHVSDTDLDERFFTGLGADNVSLKSKEIQRKDISNPSETNNTLRKQTKHSSFPTTEERHSSLSTVIPEISNYPFDTNVTVIQNNGNTEGSVMDLELDDDVFEEDSCNDASLSAKILPNTEAFCESVKTKSDENLFEECFKSENISCSECKSNVNKDMNKSKCDTEANSLVTNIKSIRCNNLCNECKVRYENILVSCEEKKEPVCVQNPYKSTEINSRHSSTLSLESSGYAELSSNESCSNSPIITHRV